MPRLLKSISSLNAPIYIMDSGSTDRTVEVAKEHGAEVAVNPFENHPKQWNHALNYFKIKTPWIIGLDADHVVTDELLEMLRNFRDENIPEKVNGIFFNRKNYFKGRWIKHGGYFPKYMLKMFRTGVGKSDLSQNMDHRFMVPGETVVWKKGYLLEENLKENDISFWIAKHNKYSSLQAIEEIEREKGQRASTVDSRFFGNPDERTAWLKNLWWNMPLFVRPMIYFIWRYFFQLGFLDGRQGFIFHFLQAFWYRLLIDIKINEHKNQN